MARRRLASYVPEPVKRPLRGVRRRIVRVRDSVGSRAAVLAAALPKPPEPRVEGISQRLLEAKRTELAAARHFGRHDLAAMEALLERADDVVTVGEAFRRRDAWPERFVALRHDMDHDVENSVRMAKWEADRGWRSTYYVLHTDWYWGDKGPANPSPLVLRALDEIASLGHEIGVHNNAVAHALLTGGDPRRILDEVLTALRAHSHAVVGTAAHGDGICRRAGFVNFEMFSECPHPDGLSPTRTLEYRDLRSGAAHHLALTPFPMSELGLEYEAYFVGNTRYLSEAEGRWNQSPDDLRTTFHREGGFLQILTHPAHWAFQGEVVKPIPILRKPASGAVDPTVGDPAAPPFPIVVRGDCCSRRAVFMNRDLFGANPQMVRDEKSRTDFLLDHLVMGSPTPEDVNRYVDLDRLKGSHRDYAITQTTRDTLAVAGARLIILDSYADMNFKAWRHRERGWKMWIYPAYLRDQAEFDRDFESLGYLSLDEAVELNARLIERYRSQVGDVPVLYLQQPTAFYRKLDHRIEFRRLGMELQKSVPNVFVGDVDDSQLVPDDMGSSGPGQTLHFDGTTYRRMIQVALDQGLGQWLQSQQISTPS
jgi:hypothetical protein